MQPTPKPKTLYFILLRVSPSSTPEQVDKLYETVTDELKAHTKDTPLETVRLRAYGACTHLLIARTEALHRISCVPSSGALKKSQIVYGLEMPDSPLTIFDDNPADAPLALVTFAKVHERLALLGQDEVVSRVVAAVRQNPRLNVARSLAWADLIFVATGKDLNELDALLPDGFCNQLWENCADGATFAPYGQGHPLEELEKEAERCPVFSRCFTMFTRRYDLPADNDRLPDFSAIQGAVPAASAQFWVRAGDSCRVVRAVQSAADARWKVYTNKGYEDLAAHLPEGADLGLAEMLREFEVAMVSDASTGLLSARLNLLSRPEMTGTDHPLADLPFHLVQQDPPKKFIDFIKEYEFADDIVLVLERMYWVCNRLMRNRVQFPFVADIALHLHDLRVYLDEVASGPQAPSDAVRKSCALIRREAGHVAAAVAQRSHGDYYDLFSDAPNVIFEYPAGIQRLFIAWWFLASRIIKHSAPDAMSIYIMVGQGEVPAAVTMGGGALLSFPPSLVYGSTDMLWSLCHEIGEVVFASDLVPDGTGLHGRSQSPHDFARILSNRDIGLPSHEYWTKTGWRNAVTTLMREVYCDAFALLGPLTCDPEPAFRHFRKRILQINNGDKEITWAAFRALIVANVAAQYVPLEREPTTGHPYLTLDPLPGVPSPSPNVQWQEREWRTMVETARSTIGAQLGEAEWTAWSQAWDTAVETMTQLGLLDYKVVAVANYLVELALNRALFLQLERLPRSGPEYQNVRTVLDAVVSWASAAVSDADESTNTCSWLLHLADRASRVIGQEVWPKLSSPPAAESHLATTEEGLTEDEG